MLSVYTWSLQWGPQAIEKITRWLTTRWEGHVERPRDERPSFSELKTDTGRKPEPTLPEDRCFGRKRHKNVITKF